MPGILSKMVFLDQFPTYFFSFRTGFQPGCPATMLNCKKNKNAKQLKKKTKNTFFIPLRLRSLYGCPEKNHPKNIPLTQVCVILHGDQDFHGPGSQKRPTHT